MSRKIVIINFAPSDDGIARALVSELVEHFDLETFFQGTRAVPKHGFDPSRNQHLAGAFLEELRAVSESPATKYLGVTAADLYSRGLNLVFGQADVGGTAAVISLARLHPESVEGNGAPELFRSRIIKEAVHELGHTFGLAHCRDKYCVMHFSRELADTDIKSARMCSRHRAELSLGTGL